MLVAISVGAYLKSTANIRNTYIHRNCFKSDKVAEISYASRCPFANWQCRI